MDNSGIIIIILSSISVITAQFLKYFITLILTKKSNLKLLFTTGGFPSSHTSLTTTLATSIYILHGGANNGFFPIAFVLMIIIAHDAMGIRLHSGKQAETINKMVDDLQKSSNKVFRPEAKKLKEELGHKPYQVIGGMGYGFLIGLIALIL